MGTRPASARSGMGSTCLPCLSCLPCPLVPRCPRASRVNTARPASNSYYNSYSQLHNRISIPALPDGKDLLLPPRGARTVQEARPVRTSRDYLGSRVQGWTSLTNSCWLALRTWKLRLSPVCLQRFRDPHSISRNTPQGYGDSMGIEDRGQEAVHYLDTVHTLRYVPNLRPRANHIQDHHDSPSALPACTVASSAHESTESRRPCRRFANHSQTILWLV